MGLYKRIELMQINGLMDILQPKVFTVYKITCVHTGHFYIGQTERLKDRVYDHVLSIMCLLENRETKPQPFHLKVADYVTERIRRYPNSKVEKTVRDAIQIYVIAIVDNRETARLVESHYIIRNSLDDLCLNIAS